MIYVDVVLRAKEAFQEGEQYWRWSEHPEERRQHLEERRRRQIELVTKELGSGKMASEEAARQREIIDFDFEQALKESPIKYAYISYQTAVELFSPPESSWVRRAREKMPLAKERWKAELRARQIPFEDYMID
jgi:hypothetical protein